MSEPTDSELRSHFEALRAADEQSVPGFRAILDRPAHAPTVGAIPRWHWPLRAALAIAAAILFVAGLARLPRRRDFVAPPLSTWDFTDRGLAARLRFGVAHVRHALRSMQDKLTFLLLPSHKRKMTMKTSRLLLAAMIWVASIAHAQNPIFVINGVQLPQCGPASGVDLVRLANIDPNVIENIEIIKGPAAAQQYGAAAANGAITISTKKGSVVSPMVCGAAPGGSGATTNAANDPVAKHLSAPEFVMAHQGAIAMTDRQRAALQDVVRDVQSKAVVDAQLKLAATGEKLSRALARPSVDEAVVLQQLDEMLALEREVKRAQMTLLIRVKNLLTPAQQGLLDKAR